MNVLVVGKPKYNIILEAESFPKENSKTKVTEKIEITGGTSVYVACMLAKWGMHVVYHGVIAGDEIGNKIKAEMEGYGVDTKFLETNYEQRSNINYVLLNKSNGSSTEIEHDNQIYAQKFKYDMAYDYVITDGSDMGASMAVANNYPTSKIILLANKVSDEYYNLSKRSAYVCANVNFAEALTKLKYEFNRPKSLVDFYQKIKDLNKAEYILMLRDKGVLYTKDRQVKMIPAIKVEKVYDDSNSGAAFFGAYAYGIINNYDMDEVAKIANISASFALKKIGTLKTIPTKEEVYELAGFKEGEGVKKEVKTESAPAPVNQSVLASPATSENQNPAPQAVNPAPNVANAPAPSPNPSAPAPNTNSVPVSPTNNNEGATDAKVS